MSTATSFQTLNEPLPFCTGDVPNKYIPFTEYYAHTNSVLLTESSGDKGLSEAMRLYYNVESVTFNPAGSIGLVTWPDYVPVASDGGCVEPVPDRCLDSVTLLPCASDLCSGTCYIDGIPAVFRSCCCTTGLVVSAAVGATPGTYHGPGTASNIITSGCANGFVTVGPNTATGTDCSPDYGGTGVIASVDFPSGTGDPIPFTKTFKAPVVDPYDPDLDTGYNTVFANQTYSDPSPEPNTKLCIATPSGVCTVGFTETYAYGTDPLALLTSEIGNFSMSIYYDIVADRWKMAYAFGFDLNISGSSAPSGDPARVKIASSDGGGGTTTLSVPVLGYDLLYYVITLDSVNYAVVTPFTLSVDYAEWTY